MIQTEKKSREDYLDLSKGCLIVLLYIYHTESHFDGDHTWSFLFQPFFLAAFFIISGYLAFKNVRDISWDNTLNQVFRTLLLPYFIFTVSFFFVKSIFMSGDEIWTGITDVLLLRASWFVIALSVLKIGYCWLLKKIANFQIISLITFALWTIGYCLIIYYRHSNAPFVSSILMNSTALPNRMPLCFNVALITSPFFYAGILWRHYHSYINLNKSWWYILSVCAIYVLVLTIDRKYLGSYVTMATHSYNNVLLIMLYAFWGSYALLLVCKKIKKLPIINYVGINSILFYFLNSVIIQFIVFCSRKLNVLTFVNGGGGTWLL